MWSDIDGKAGPVSVLLYWLPVGAGSHFVRWNCRLFEALVARHEHRTAQDLYHSALAVHIGSSRFVIEVTPVWGRRLLLALVPRVPALTWGRDEPHTGEMWNSNSVIAWLLARSDTGTIAPPGQGRAPGWRAGLVLAARPEQPALR